MSALQEKKYIEKSSQNSRKDKNSAVNLTNPISPRNGVCGLFGCGLFGLHKF